MYSLSKKLMVVATVFLMLSGCAAPPKQEDMIPEVLSSAFIHTEKVLTVSPVTGGEITEGWNVPKIENEGFQGALIAVLEDSGLFGKVSLDEGGDYLLTTKIISQEISGKWDNTIILYVSYKLTDTKTQQSVWKRNLYSQQELSVKQVFGGQERIKKLQTTAVQDNLKQLLEGLNKKLAE